MSTVTRYTRTAMALHWLIALFMLINVVLVWIVDYVGESHERTVVDLHKSIGITVLGLALLRVLWRYANPPPAFPIEFSIREQRAAHWAHVGLYLLMLGLPLTGWLHDSAWKDAASHPMALFNAIPWPRISWVMQTEPVTKEWLHHWFGKAHEWLAYGLYGLFFLHVAGALKHQFIDKTPELQRMLPGKNS